MVAVTRGQDTPRQESVLQIGDREVIVVSEVVLDPELLVVTRVMEGTVCIAKKHTPLPAAVAHEYRERGASVLSANLQLQHLRYVRHLLARDERAEASPMTAGTLATLVLGPSGEVVKRAGEEHVPAGWLRAVWVVAGIADKIASALTFGQLESASIHGEQVEATLSREGSSTCVRFATATGKPVSTEGAPTRAGILEVVRGGIVRAVGVFEAGREPLHAGFGELLPDLDGAESAARHVLRETQPRIGHLRFALERGTAVVLVAGETVVLALVEAKVLDIARLLTRLCTAPPSRAPSAPPPSTADVSCAALLEAVNRVTTAARVHIGGPVIRNYLKKARGDAAELAPFAIGLDGRVTAPDGSAMATKKLARALGAWIRRFLEQASVVAPELSTLPLGELVGELETLVLVQEPDKEKRPS